MFSIYSGRRPVESAQDGFGCKHSKSHCALNVNSWVDDPTYHLMLMQSGVYVMIRCMMGKDYP